MKERIAVMGAGAVGAYFGGMLARAGHEVTMIGRAAHVDAMRAQGLRLQTRSFDERVAVQASTDAAAVRGADIVLFSVKSPDTEAAADAIAPHLAPQAVVLCLQNGVDNADRVRARLPHEVLAAVVYVATEMAGPGHLLHHGRGDLVVEPGRGGDRLPALLRAAGVPTEVSSDVRGALWTKLVINCAYNALSAIGRVPYGPLLAVPGIDAVVADVLAECRAVAAAEGVALPADLEARVQRLPPSMPDQRSSTAQDLARGKPTEIEYLNGHIVRRGEAHGIGTPVNRTLLALVRLLEAVPGS